MSQPLITLVNIATLPAHQLKILDQMRAITNRQLSLP